MELSSMQHVCGIAQDNSAYSLLIQNGPHKMCKKDRKMSLILLARIVLWSAHQLVANFEATGEIPYTAATKITWCEPTPYVGAAYLSVAARLQEKMNGDKIRLQSVAMSVPQKRTMVDGHIEFLNLYYEPIVATLRNLSVETVFPLSLSLATVAGCCSQKRLIF